MDCNTKKNKKLNTYFYITLDLMNPFTQTQAAALQVQHSNRCILNSVNAALFRKEF